MLDLLFSKSFSVLSFMLYHNLAYVSVSLSRLAAYSKDISFIHSFIHSGHFYSAPSSPLPLRGAPDYSTDTVSEFHDEAHRQLQVKDLPKVPT